MHLHWLMYLCQGTIVQLCYATVPIKYFSLTGETQKSGATSAHTCTYTCTHVRNSKSLWENINLYIYLNTHLCQKGVMGCCSVEGYCASILCSVELVSTLSNAVLQKWLHLVKFWCVFCFIPAIVSNGLLAAVSRTDVEDWPPWDWAFSLPCLSCTCGDQQQYTVWTWD